MGGTPYPLKKNFLSKFASFRRGTIKKCERGQTRCLLPLHPALMPHLSTLLPPPVSPPPHTTDVSRTVPPSLYVIVIHLPISLIVFTIFYLTTGRKNLMTNAMIVNNEKKNY